MIQNLNILFTEDSDGPSVQYTSIESDTKIGKTSIENFKLHKDKIKMISTGVQEIFRPILIFF